MSAQTEVVNTRIGDDSLRQLVRGVADKRRNPAKPDQADQTFYLVKLIFPRGDAASLLIGFDAQGKITGINLMSMAGD